jgi:D-aminopeptidase
LESPYVLRIKMLNSGMADSAQIMPGAVRLDSLTMEYRTDEVLTMFNGLLTLVYLGGMSIPKVRDK